MQEEVKQALESVRSHLRADGGDIELVEVDEVSGTVKVRLVGACDGCPGARFTLANGVGRVLRERVPGVKHVVAV
ncbi:MAG: NifU family protein [Chloroflexi bacterium]|nr:NifU family protein [Chloroflexota bacterium]MCL5110918.1 NifU family protein [Chloroflexota bacterium]